VKISPSGLGTGRRRDAALSRQLVHQARRSAPVLGKKGVEAMQSELTADSSLYDAYNHLTLVSQQRKMGPRQKLELLAGSLVGMGIE